MKVIDARNGVEVKVGDTVTYFDGSSWTLLSVDPGILSARAYVRSKMKSVCTGFDPSRPNPPFLVSEYWQPLAVRFTHPKYFGQHIAFFPS